MKPDEQITTASNVWSHRALPPGATGPIGDEALLLRDCPPLSVWADPSPAQPGCDLFLKGEDWQGVLRDLDAQQLTRLGNFLLAAAAQLAFHQK